LEAGSGTMDQVPRGPDPINEVRATTDTARTTLPGKQGSLVEPVGSHAVELDGRHRTEPPPTNLAHELDDVSRGGLLLDRPKRLPGNIQPVPSNLRRPRVGLLL
jgi:hypothetical protein